MIRIKGDAVRLALGAGIALCCLGALLWHGMSLAQMGGRFAGQVVDITTGRAVSGALIAVDDIEVVSDDRGRFELALPAGVWAIHAQAPGYIGMTLAWQRLNEGEQKALDFELIPTAVTPEQRSVLERKLPIHPQTDPELAGTLAEQRGYGLTAVTALPQTIRVLMPDDTVVVMDLDEYVRGVVPHEMGYRLQDWPMEGLKAQAVAARCYAANARKHLDQGADVCTTTHCQVWRPVYYDTTDQAVRETHGVAAMYDGQVIEAYYHSHCDGHTRNSEDVWGGYRAYCRSVACPCGFTWKSGHGVGMCQWGAGTLAQQGLTYDLILKHYYTGITVTGLAAPSLDAGSVSPGQGNAYTPFTFQVTYQDADGDRPVEAVVEIDGISYGLTHLAGDHRSGALYGVTMTLPPGTHRYRFHVADGFGGVADWPVQGTLDGPTVTEPSKTVATPTATLQPNRTMGGTWVQSTSDDWSYGELVGLELVDAGNGALALAGDALSGRYTSQPFHSPYPFMAIGATWLADLPSGSGLMLEVRRSPDGVAWEPWATIELEDTEREDDSRPYAQLIFGDGCYIQYRLTLSRERPSLTPLLHSVTWVYIDSRNSPTVAEAKLASAMRSDGGPAIISRSAWGAEESWMTWAPEYQPVKTFIIHHTVTSSGGADPVAVVQAIYYYHAVTRDWGDIGYNYVIDDQGNIYEGRFGGEAVVGGHAKNYNWGSIGVAILGDYTSETPSPAALNALVELLAWKGNLHLVEPLENTFFLDKTLPTIMGHKDCSSYTSCPGAYLYSQLPIVRQRVMTRMAQLPPVAKIVAPADGATLRGVQQVDLRGSPAVTSLTVWVDGQRQITQAGNRLLWRWNTAQWPDGVHQITLQGGTAVGLADEARLSVIVDNTPPSGGLSVTPLTNSATVRLDTPAQGASQMQVSYGWGWEGEALRHQDDTGAVVTDPLALNGAAWFGQAGQDTPGAWYGQYVCDAPEWRTYWAAFRIKVGENVSDQIVAQFDVVDEEGRYVYKAWEPQAWELAYAGQYMDVSLPFYFGERGDTCQSPAAEDGLEFRTWFRGNVDLWLDRVDLFAAPEAHAQTKWVTLAEGRHQLGVRYLDAVGNPSDVYTATTLVDLTVPQWVGCDLSGRCQVRDVLSGLDVSSGQYAISADGVSWSPWLPALVDGADGVTDTVSIQGAVLGAAYVRYRVTDLAGNVATSLAYGLPASWTATPTVCHTATVPTETATPSPTQTIGWARWHDLPRLMREHDAGQTVSPTAAVTVTPVPTGTATPTGALPTATATLPTATPTASMTLTASPTLTLFLTPTATPTLTAYTTVIITGTVYDAGLGLTTPISDADVTVTIGALLMDQQTQTDAAGVYTTTFHLPAFPAGVMASVIVTHPGYAIGYGVTTLSQGVLGGSQRRQVNVGLHPFGTPTPTPTLTAEIVVYGTVYEQGTSPIAPVQGAAVQAFLPGETGFTVSDELGRYEIRFQVGSGLADERVDVVALKSGYNMTGLRYGRVPPYDAGDEARVLVDVPMQRN